MKERYYSCGKIGFAVYPLPIDRQNKAGIVKFFYSDPETVYEYPSEEFYRRFM